MVVSAGNASMREVEKGESKVIFDYTMSLTTMTTCSLGSRRHTNK